MTHAEMRAHLRAAPAGAGLHATLSAVLLHVGPDGEPCSASLCALSDVAGIDERQTRRNVRALIAAGCLTTEVRPGRVSLLTPVAHDPGHGRPRSPRVGTPVAHDLRSVRKGRTGSFSTSTSGNQELSVPLAHVPAHEPAPVREDEMDELVALLLADGVLADTKEWKPPR